jgi:hypothetical protein
MADDDCARRLAKKNLVERLELQELKHGIIENSDILKSKKYSENDFSKVAWMLLAALNADRIKTFHMEELRPYIEIASSLPVNQSYPIFAWLIQNTVKRFSNTDQARTIIRNMYNSLMIATELSGRIGKCSSIQNKKSVMRESNNSSDNTIIIRAGERDKAITFVKQWIEKDVNEFLKINDPYFCIADLDLLLLIKEIKPNCKVFISTSKKAQEQEQLPFPWEEEYRSYWRLKLSDQDPPDCEIVIISIDNTGEHPIHDRWWITNGSGFRMGTSYKSLGVGKDSEISKLSIRQVEEIEMEIDRFLINRIKEHNGRRLYYSLLNL